jgi:hypothetical protein
MVWLPPFCIVSFASRATCTELALNFPIRPDGNFNNHGSPATDSMTAPMSIAKASITVKYRGLKRLTMQYDPNKKNG